jgi:hypothetical protein
MIEGELGHRRRGRAVNRQSVVGDAELDVPAMQEAGELGRLGCPDDDGRTPTGERAGNGFSGEELSPPTTIRSSANISSSPIR